MKSTKEEGVAGTCQDCDCSCGYHGHDRHPIFLLRIVLGMVIIIAVFCMGIKVGEVKAFIESFKYQNHFQDRGTMLYSGEMMNVRGVPAMMTTQATPTTTTVKK